MHCGKDFRIKKPCKVKDESKRSESKSKHVGSSKLLQLKIDYVISYVLFHSERFYKVSMTRNFNRKRVFENSKKEFIGKELNKLYYVAGSVKNLKPKLVKPLILAFDEIEKRNFIYEKKKFPKDSDQKEIVKKCDKVKGVEPVNSVLFEYYLGKMLT